MGCRRMLGIEDRAAIMAGVNAGLSQTRIAHLIGRSPSVVCREIARHTGPDGQYRAEEAGKAARAARRRPKKRLLDRDEVLRRRVIADLSQGHTPRQISGRLRAEACGTLPSMDTSPDAQGHTVSHEAIYTWIYAHPKKTLIEHGIVQSFNRVVDVVGSDGSHNQVPAGIIAPIKVGDRTVGTLKFYYKTPRAVDRTQYALASGFAEILSTQLAIHELEVQKELTARAEVRALQAQINPHFLFNTLNTIASFTRTDPLRARELLREFSSFYRATLDNSGSLIPVSREVAQTKRYLTFEKARFGEDRVLATFDVSEDVEDTLVPAFVIQPIVENAVRHGMGDGDALQIDVTVHQDGDDAILIAVADNGVGMDEGTAARLFDERSARPDASSPQGGGAGVAMHNISERIHRFYGPHSYTRVESAPGKGTKVLLHLDLSESIFDIQE